MKKIYGAFLLLLSAILCLWFALSVFGLLGRLSNGLPTEAYGMGVMVGQSIVYVIFGYLGLRAFKAGKAKLFEKSEV
jgi:hypothetical protein